jgi:uncharacterized protein
MPWALRMSTYAGIVVVILLVYFSFRYFSYVRFLNLKPLWFYRSLFFILSGMFLAYPLAGYLQFLLQGTFRSDTFPVIMVYFFWYGIICMGVMLNWLLLHDILLPLFTRFADFDSVSVRIRAGKILLIIAGLTVIYTAVKLAWDTNRIAVENIAYDPGDGYSPEEPLTIVHIADLHADNYTGQRKMDRYIRKVNNANPDIVIFAGDLISSGRDFIEAGADALAGIKSKYGTWFVMGDHDYWVSTEEIAEVLDSRGINVLQNENATIRHGDMVIRITGVNELYSNKIDQGQLEELLDENLGEALRLLVSHQATERIIRTARDHGVHQVLAGHTHGGQIRVRLFGYPVTASRVESRYVTGHWRFGKMLLNINNGLGFTLTPVRYNAPAQVTVIKVE